MLTDEKFTGYCIKNSYRTTNWMFLSPQTGPNGCFDQKIIAKYSAKKCLRNHTETAMRVKMGLLSKEIPCSEFRFYSQQVIHMKYGRYYCAVAGNSFKYSLTLNLS